MKTFECLTLGRGAANDNGRGDKTRKEDFILGLKDQV